MFNLLPSSLCVVKVFQERLRRKTLLPSYLSRHKSLNAGVPGEITSPSMQTFCDEYFRCVTGNLDIHYLNSAQKDFPRLKTKFSFRNETKGAKFKSQQL